MSCHLDHDPSSLEHRARRRVALKGSLFIHALVYTLVNSGLYLLWTLQGATTAAGVPRAAHLPLWGWALGLGIHAIVVAVLLAGDGLRRRMIEREMRSLRAQAKG